MATVNEQIVTGRKFRKLVDEATKLWQRISFWTRASDVEFNDGSTAETKMGAINGITDSLVSTSSNIAASAKSVNQLNNKLNGCSLKQEGEDFFIVGADAVRKKLGDSSIKFYETNIKMSQSSFVNINCGFRPRHFIYTILWGGNAIAAYIVNIDKGTQKYILGYGGSGTYPTNVPRDEEAIYIICEITDTGMRLKAPSNTHAQNTAYFYIFG